jgi:hypothetical protein
VGKIIVCVQFYNPDAKAFKGKIYNYFAEIPLAVGDMVIAPTIYGDELGKVIETDIPEEKVDERFLPRLRTITKKFEGDAQQWSSL